MTAANAQVAQRQVHRLDGDAGAPVERARDAEADRGDLADAASRISSHRVDDHVQQLGLVEAEDRAVGTVMRPPVGVDGAGKQLGATEVDADHVISRPRRPPYTRSYGRRPS